MVDTSKLKTSFRLGEAGFFFFHEEENGKKWCAISDKAAMTHDGIIDDFSKTHDAERIEVWRCTLFWVRS